MVQTRVRSLDVSTASFLIGEVTRLPLFILMLFVGFSFIKRKPGYVTFVKYVRKLGYNAKFLQQWDAVGII